MSSLLNNASLLLNPAGSIISYQEDKIYSVLPKDGTGDFTFSGGDGGTRVNQQGYVEVTPANINTYSEKFGPGYWNNFGGTITDDSVIAPNGTVTGTTFNGSPAGTYKQFGGIVPGQIYTVSMYVKLGTATNCVIIINNTQNWNTVGGKSFTSADGLNTTDWTRISFTFTGPAYGAINWHIGVHSETAVTQQTNGSYFVWGAMLNIGSVALPYQPTTDRLNYPRITYQNGRGALLSEPQRTNVTTNSQIISAFTGTTVSLDSGISPDGTQNADKLIEDTSTGIHITIFGGSLGGSVDSSTFCVSIFAKAAERTRFEIFDNGQAAGAAVNYFDLGNGTKISGNGTIENYGNGWYRCIIFPSKTDSTTANIQIRLINTGTNDSYTGDGSSGIFFWGKQIEAGTFPTSYIPTTTATVTRPADASSDTSATSVIGQTEGVIYSDLFFEPNGAERNYIYLNDSTGYNAGFCYLVGSSTNRLALDLYNNPYTQQFSALSPVLTAGRYKAAIAYKQNDFAFYLNGVQIGTDNSGTVPTLDRVYIGQGSDLGFPQGGPVFTTALFNTRLTNTQLQELTTVRSGSGGNISYNGPYTIHTFTGSATFTPSFNGQVEVLVVAGGGGTGYDVGGGGGGGGVIYTSAYGVAASSGITVTIGAGGTSGQVGSVAGGNGGNSVFGGLTALGGGGGGAYPSGQVNGLDGGSGGGAGNQSAVGGSGSIGQGFNGGSSSAPWGSGGGGGAAGNGTNGIQNQTVLGGLGATYSISGFSTTYSGGGFGAFDSQTLRPTGQDSNGLTLGYYGYGANGTGSPNNSPYIGNQGIVIVRYLT